MILRKLTLTTLFFVCLVTLTSSSDRDVERFRLMGEADEAISKGEWEKADSILVEALNVTPGDPTNTLIMSNLGIVRYNMGKDSLALSTLNDAVSLAPASVTVLSNRARVRSGMGDIDGARDDYRHIITLDSSLVSPHFYLSIMALAEGDTATAANHARRVVALQPDGVEAALVMASLMSARGYSAEAITYYNKLIQLDPQAEYYAARALCHLQADDLGAAADDIASGLQLDPADGELYLYRAILNKMRFRPEDAKADARRALQLGVSRQRVDAAMR